MASAGVSNASSDSPWSKQLRQVSDWASCVGFAGNELHDQIPRFIGTAGLPGHTIEKIENEPFHRDYSRLLVTFLGHIE